VHVLADIEHEQVTVGAFSDWIQGRLGGSKAMLMGAVPMTFAFSTAANAWSVSAITAEA